MLLAHRFNAGMQRRDALGPHAKGRDIFHKALPEEGLGEALLGYGTRTTRAARGKVLAETSPQSPHLAALLTHEFIRITVPLRDDGQKVVIHTEVTGKRTERCLS